MKLITVAIICFLMGFGAYWGYGSYQRLMKENADLKKMTEDIPSSAVNIEPTVTLSPEKQMKEKGVIEGVLGYPSEMIPPLYIYAYSVNDKAKYYMIETSSNQGVFVIKEVDPGDYYVVAYLSDDPDNGFSGSYTKAVPCGLSVLCNDHSLIAVSVKPGETTSQVEVRDWYAPPGTFPARPTE